MSIELVSEYAKYDLIMVAARGGQCSAGRGNAQGKCLERPN